MKVAFRVDASLQIGTGHVMRCLTLADALAAQGADCLFICREHQGNLIEQIRSKGYRTHALPVLPSVGASLLALKAASEKQSPAHSHWLGATQVEDAAACTAILAEVNPDWLIVDHYALDSRWEIALKPHHRKLMVIDDLADRPHICQVLLDQTFGRDAGDYQPWVSAGTTLLCGSRYALLRPEFAQLRSYSLQRRANPQLRQLLITMGGVDKDNATGQVLDALNACALPDDCHITVIMGGTSPWLDHVRRQAEQMPWPTEVLVGVSNMAQLMSDSDLAIGAAGATSWERCCLGLPTIMLILAENQKTAAALLGQTEAVLSLSLDASMAAELQGIITSFGRKANLLTTISGHAQSISDGTGCQHVVRQLILKATNGQENMLPFGKIREIKPEELELMLSWRNAPNVRANMYTRHEISLDEHLAWWTRTRQRNDQQYFMYEINSVPLGIVGFTEIDTLNQNASWAFYASPDAPKGTGSKMEFLALEFAFGGLGLHKLHCEVLNFNEAVIKLHQKFGFQVEGIFREHHKVDGQFVDIQRLGLLKQEWTDKCVLMREKLEKLSKG